MAPVGRHEFARMRVLTAWLLVCAALGIAPARGQVASPDPYAPRAANTPATAPDSALNRAAQTPLGPGSETVGMPQPSQPPADTAPAGNSERVVDIRIIGNRRLTREQVLNNMGTRLDRPFDQSTFEKDVRKLTSRAWFVHVVPKREHVPGGVIITLNVVERPVLEYVYYHGNSMKERRLAKETGLKKGDAFDPFAVQEAARKIESFYHSKGYTDCKVEVPEGTRHTDRGAVFVIHEGKIVKFSDVRFKGNDPSVAPDGRLKGIVQSKEPILFFFKGKVDRNIIESDVEKLTDYYRGLGFFKATVSRYYEFNDEEDRMALTFEVKEGPRYKVRNIAFIGNKIYPDEAFLPNFKLTAGKYYDLNKVNSDAGVIKDLYGSNGYVFADAVPEFRFLEEPGEVDLIFRVTEGEQYRIGDVNIAIKGDNPHTRYSTVMNRLSMRPGDIANIQDFRNSERRLKASGLFNTDPQKGETPRIVFSPPDPEAELAKKNKRERNRPTGNPDTFRGQSPDNNVSGNYGGTRMPVGQPVGAQRAVAPGPEPQPTQPVRTSPTTGSSPQGWSAPGAARPAVSNPSASSSAAASSAAQPAVYQAPPQTSGTGVQRAQFQQYPPSTPYQQYPSFTAPAAAQPVGSLPAGDVSVRPAPIVRGQDGGYGGRAVNTLPPGPQPYAVNQPTSPPGGYAPGYGENGAPPAVPPGGSLPSGIGEPPLVNPNGGFLNGGAEPVIAPPPTIPIDIQVSEAQTGRFMLGAGVNSNAGVVGSIILDEQNFDWRRFPTSWEDFRSGRAFRGDGQKFRIEAAPGTVVQRYLFNFAEPYLFDTPVSFGFSGFYFNRFYRDWAEQRIGGRVNFGYQFTPDLSGTVGFRGENVLINNPRIANVPDIVTAMGGPNGNGHTELYAVSAGLAHDTRDNTFLPTEGHYIVSNFEYFEGTFQYPRYSLNAQQHWLLRERPDSTGRHTFSYYGQLGFSGSDTPVYERFYAGGFSTLRGFQFRGASPQQGSATPGVTGTAIVGGDFQFLNTLEYMFPVSADDMFKMVAFVDFGTVEPTVSQTSWSDTRIAPGIGIRVTIPMISPAPIAVDLAVPVQHANGDLLQNISFFVGVGR